MIKTNLKDFTEKCTDYVNQVIIHNDIVNVNTKNGKAIIISEKYYNNLMENCIVKK